MSLIAEPWQAVLLYGVVFAVGNGMASLAPVGVMVTRAFPGRTGFANSAVICGMCLGQLVMIAALTAVLAEHRLALGVRLARHRSRRDAAVPAAGAAAAHGAEGRRRPTRRD